MRTQKKPKYYITTPLYYPSGKWHLGHCYTTVCCDSLARFKRMSGYDVFFLTGTDEHGQKIADSANNAGMETKAYIDMLSDEIKQLWTALYITNNKFIRTTDDYHVKSVQSIFTRLYKQGDIYKSSYRGKYCKPCEAFWTASQLNNGKCPDCGRDVSDAEEDCYFFALSKYSDRLEVLLSGGDFLSPPSRVKEMINNFIKPGLNDLAVSRNSVKWGIPVDFDKEQTVYVWIDALSNYINALGYNGDNKNMEFWPADLHMVGKEIVRFHAIVWPAILMALDLPVPKKIYGHGWLLMGGDKMSKSKGNVTNPFFLIDRYGADAVRYYLLREIPFGQDGSFTNESFITRINSDLVNDLGNLVKRTVAMANQYCGGKIIKPAKEFSGDITKGLTEKIDILFKKVENALTELSSSKALEEIFILISASNKYIDQNAPWTLKKEGKTDEVNSVLYNLLESIRVCATMLLPFIPDGASKIFKMLNIPCPADFSSASFGVITGYNLCADEILYKRIEMEKELEIIRHKEEEISANKTPAANTVTPAPAAALIQAASPAPAATVNAASPDSEKGEISIDEFFKTQLAVAEIVSAERVEKADKLLKLQVKCGEEGLRTVVSGIAKHYSPEEIIGKQVVLVKNLKPVNLRGIMSYGMLLCASDVDNVVLVSPEKIVTDGSVVS